jgi:hypothetical protein
MARGYGSGNLVGSQKEVAIVYEFRGPLTSNGNPGILKEIPEQHGGTHMRSKLAALCLVFLSGPSIVFGQLTTGQVLGTVVDSQGLGIPNAQVTFRNERTGQTFEVQSSALGDYLVRSLPVGEYAVTVQASGFKRFTRTGIILTANQVARLDITLEVGGVTELLITHKLRRQ